MGGILLKVIFFTVATDLFKDYALMTERSFHKFHPDIEFRIYGGEYYRHGMCTPTMELGKSLHKDFDLVVHIDSDCIVCGPLPEILTEEYDVAAPLNNNTFSEGVHLFNINPEDYLSCALTAVRKEDFWDHWKLLTNHYGEFLPLVDNDAFNLAFYYGNYKKKVLDRDEVFYGTSSLPFWKEYRVEEEKIMCKNRVVKVMHRAGGSNPTSRGVKEQSYREVGFSPEVCARFDYLTQ